MFSSIRTKLTLLYVGILAAFMITIAAVTYYAIIRSMDRDLNVRLLEMSNNFAVALAAEQEDSKDDSEGHDAVAETASEMRFRDYQFIVYSPEGKLLASTAGFDIPFTEGTELGHFANLNIDGKQMKVFRTGIRSGGETLHLYVTHSLDERTAMESELVRIFLVGFPLTLIFAGLCGYFLARRSLGPMVEMGRQAGRISAQNLDERLLVKNRKDELGQLAEIFNRLLSRLDAAFKQQRRFMADASHELRTPLAIVRGESEVALSNPERSAVEYRESLAIVHDESKRLTRIVEDLFTLARADAGQIKARLAPVYLDEIVNDSVRSISVLAREKNIKVEVISAAEMPMNGDEPLLHRLFLNMLDNAVKYGRENGIVAVNCSTTPAGTYVVSISDNGIGIPTDEQGSIFERFYRVDKARSRSTKTGSSGAGLGLAIASWIAEIHGGKIDLISSDEHGSSFSVEFIRDGMKNRPRRAEI